MMAKGLVLRGVAVLVLRGVAVLVLRVAAGSGGWFPCFAGTSANAGVRDQASTGIVAYSDTKLHPEY